MNKLQFRQLIREEIRKVLKEASSKDIMPVVKQFVAAVKKKYGDALYDVRMFKVSGSSNEYQVQAFVDIQKWDVSHKYWANKFTKNFGNTVPGIQIDFSTEPTPAGSASSKRGKSVLK